MTQSPTRLSARCFVEAPADAVFAVLGDYPMGRYDVEGT